MSRNNLLIDNDFIDPGTPPINPGNPGQTGSWVGFNPASDPGIPTPTGSGVFRYVVPTGGLTTGSGLTLATAITMGRAWTIAQPGDVIRMQDGNYGEFWAGGTAGHYNSNYTAWKATGPCNGTATDPITFVGENPPSFNSGQWGTRGARFNGTTSNGTNAFYVGNCQYVRFWRFEAAGGQTALVVGNESWKPPMGPAHNIEFRYHHVHHGNQELVVVKHDSNNIYFYDFLHEISNVTHVTVPNFTNGMSPAAFSAGLASVHLLGEAVYYGYNNAGEATANLHASWPSTSGPGYLEMKRGTWKKVEGAEVVDMKEFGTGNCLIEDCIVDECNACFEGVFNNVRTGKTMTLRNIVLREITRHWTSIYDPAIVISGKPGSVVNIENMIAWNISHTYGPFFARQGSINGKHITVANQAATAVGIAYADNGGSYSFTDCMAFAVPTLAAGWTGGSLSDVVGPTTGDRNTGIGIGSGFKPKPTASWATTGTNVPTTDLVKITRSASCAKGALEP